MNGTQLHLVSRGHELITPPGVVRGLAQLCETAGRTCYKSEEKIAAGSADQFLRGLIKSGHASVIEHGSITVKIICDRSTSHQLVRHRIAAYSQESQRYCDYSGTGLKVIAPPQIGLEPGVYSIGERGTWLGPSAIYHIELAPNWLTSIHHSYGCYLHLRQAGIPPQDARSVLPNATKTEVVTTFNLRQWRHVFEHRALNPRAQYQIRSITQGILAELAGLLPAIFEDQAKRISAMD